MPFLEYTLEWKWLWHGKPGIGRERAVFSLKSAVAATTCVCMVESGRIFWMENSRQCGAEERDNGARWMGSWLRGNGWYYERKD